MSSEHRITRRNALTGAGALGAAYLVGPLLIEVPGGTAIAANDCARLTPELTEGPYWVNTMLHRSDVRANSHGGGHQDGVPLRLTINVVDSSKGCKPLNGLAVDIWHANGNGLYSDESSQQAGGGTSGGDTISDNWLRGYQITGKDRGSGTAPSTVRSALRRSGLAGTAAARSISMSVSASSRTVARRSPATRPRSSSQMPTTTGY